MAGSRVAVAVAAAPPPALAPAPVSCPGLALLLLLLRSPLFWPVLRAARAALGESTAFPPVERFGRVFLREPYGAGGTDDEPPPVRFVVAAPRPRRRGRRKDAVDPRTLYDARITLDGVVPSRPGSWHDLMNALVWGTFPRAKRALHARQHRAVSERIEPGARTLPPSRTRELDALALLDEGGVVLPARGAGDPARPIIFGHAIYESLARGIAPAVVAAIEIDAGARERAPGGADPVAADLAAIDAALARVIDDPSRLQTPEELGRIDLGAYA